MVNFKYRDGTLFCEEMAVEKIARDIGTPFYLYSYNAIISKFRAFDKALSEVPHLICYAMKANSNIGVLKAIASQGGGAEIVSGGELYRALKAGIDPEKIVFTGVGKKENEIRKALETDILMFSIESIEELDFISEVSEKMRKEAKVSFRINPDIDPDTNPYISTGLKKNKFGLSPYQAEKGYLLAANRKKVKIVGIHTHIGSQISELKPFKEAFHELIEFIKRLQGKGIGVQLLDVGGGLGIQYDKGDKLPTFEEYGEVITSSVKALDFPIRIIAEPGRAIVGNAGILVTEVLYVKRDRGKNFVIVDAGMNDILRPCLYQAHHEIKPLKKKGKPSMIADIVGPVCESADFIALDREIPGFHRGDKLAIMDVGAYGFAMSSNYNSRPRISEVMVKNDKFAIVRDGESYRDFTKLEQVPPFLR